MRPSAYALALFLWLCSAVSGVRAEKPDQNRQLAKTLVQEATGAYERKDFDKAQQLLEAAYRLYRSDKIQYSLGRVQEAQRRPVQALASYRRFLSGVPLPERQRGQTEDAEAAIRRLEAQLGRLHVTGPGGSWFQVDGGERCYLPFEPVWVEPGVRRVTFAGGVQDVAVQLGELAAFPLPSAEPAPVPLVVPKPVVVAPVRPRPSRTRIARWTLLSVGLALVIAGVGVWGADKRPTCALAAGQTHCPERLNTEIVGAALLTGGLFSAGMGALLYGIERAPGPTPALAVVGRF